MWEETPRQATEEGGKRRAQGTTGATRGSTQESPRDHRGPNKKKAGTAATGEGGAFAIGACGSQGVVATFRRLRSAGGRRTPWPADGRAIQLGRQRSWDSCSTCARFVLYVSSICALFMLYLCFIKAL